MNNSTTMSLDIDACITGVTNDAADASSANASTTGADVTATPNNNGGGNTNTVNNKKKADRSKMRSVANLTDFDPGELIVATTDQDPPVYFGWQEDTTKIREKINKVFSDVFYDYKGCKLVWNPTKVVSNMRGTFTCIIRFIYSTKDSADKRYAAIESKMDAVKREYVNPYNAAVLARSKSTNSFINNGNGKIRMSEELMNGIESLVPDSISQYDERTGQQFMSTIIANGKVNYAPIVHFGTVQNAAKMDEQIPIMLVELDLVKLIQLIKNGSKVFENKDWNTRKSIRYSVHMLEDPAKTPGAINSFGHVTGKTPIPFFIEGIDVSKIKNKPNYIDYNDGTWL